MPKNCTCVCNVTVVAERGEPGPQGEQGIQGIQGEKGDPGVNARPRAMVTLKMQEMEDLRGWGIDGGPFDFPYDPGFTTVRVDLTDFTEVRMTSCMRCGSQRVGNPRIGICYTDVFTGETTAWRALGASVPVPMADLPAGPVVSEWAVIPTEARADVYITYYGFGGVAQPVVPLIMAEFR